MQKAKRFDSTPDQPEGSTESESINEALDRP